MDIQISQTCCRSVLVSLTTAAYYFWAEHVQYCLIWEDSMWFGQIQNVKKYNLPNFEYYLKCSSTFDPLIKNWMCHFGCHKVVAYRLQAPYSSHLRQCHPLPHTASCQLPHPWTPDGFESPIFQELASVSKLVILHLKLPLTILEPSLAANWQGSASRERGCWRWTRSSDIWAWC